MRTPAAFVALAAVLAAVPAGGCGSSPPAARTSCWLCNGTGRASTGRACDSCLGNGYREVTEYEAARRREAEENLRRKDAGLPPPTWWDKYGWKSIGSLVCLALIGYARSRGPVAKRG